MSSHIRSLRSTLADLAAAIAIATDQAELVRLQARHYRAATVLLAYCSR